MTAPILPPVSLDGAAPERARVVVSGPPVAVGPGGYFEQRPVFVSVLYPDGRLVVRQAPERAEISGEALYVEGGQEVTRYGSLVTRLQLLAPDRAAIELVRELVELRQDDARYPDVLLRLCLRFDVPREECDALRALGPVGRVRRLHAWLDSVGVAAP